MKWLSDVPHWVIKLVGTIILFILCLLFGMVPMKLAQSGTTSITPKRKLLISLSNSFAGGIFFSTVVLDLFPMVKVKMHEAFIYAEIETEFPIGDFLVGVGFLMMLVLEHLIHTCCGKNTGISHEVCSEPQRNYIESDYADNNQVLDGSDTHTQRAPQGDDSEHGKTVQIQTSHHSCEPYFSTSASRILKSHSLRKLTPSEVVIQSNFRTYMLVFAISLHSIFEGICAGLIMSSSELIKIYIALLIHKTIIAFSIGVQLVEAQLPRKVVVICILIFSLMTPIGVGLAFGVVSTFGTGLKLFSSGILQGISTGTFLYVTFFEVLPNELNTEDGKKTLKILFIVIGYAFVTAICTYENQFHRLKKVKVDNSTVLIGA